MKTRILTAAVLLPLAILAIMLLPNLGFSILMAALMAVAAWEWALLARQGERARIAYAMAVLLACLGAGWLCAENAQMRRLIMWVAALWWLLATVWVMLYPRGLGVGSDRRLLTLVLGLLVMVPAYAALVQLQGMPDNGPLRLLALFALIWAADSGAYFAGRRFGQRKLAPQVSPGKTWEGVYGGLVGSAFAALVFAALLYGTQWQLWWPFALLGVAVAALSIVGDLTESMFKRHAGIKDSGNLFPGHGGMLDRADSLLAAAPCYLLGLALLGL